MARAMGERHGVAGTPAVSVVVPTRDRPALLARCVASVLRACDASGRACEVLVVDDGSEPPATVPADPRVRIVRTGGVGPSRARNAGIDAASAAVVAFTDDDCEVGGTWLAAALDAFDTDAAAAGVTGRTEAPPYDPLYEHAVTDLVGTGYLACNVAYRTIALREAGGFDRQFPHAAHEDRDLAWRVMNRGGSVRFVEEMRVIHPGRPIDPKRWAARGWLVVDDWLLLRRYPSAKASRLPVRVAPLASMVRRWWHAASGPDGIAGSPRRLARWARLAGSQLGVGAWVTATQWRYHRDRPLSPTPGLARPGLRVAYVGPVPAPSAGGASGVAGLLLRELARLGASIDCYVATSAETDDLGEIASVTGVEVVARATRFAFERWYSRHRLTKMLSHQLSTGLARRKLAATLAAQHRAVPYDVCYLFSSLEAVGVPASRRDRPPVVAHPSVHAAGELRWLRQERVLSAGLEGAGRPAAVRAWLWLRALQQGRDARRADRVLALSARFGRELVADYGIDPDRVAVVPNCVDLDRFTPADAATSPDGVDRVVSVGRLTVRKGLEDVVALSHALHDLAGSVELDVVGAGSLWSDYSSILEELDPEVGRGLGYVPRDGVAQLLSSSRCLLQLSRYEPFGLTVAEALACGVPVIVTDAVGAAEGLPEDVARIVEPGDVRGLDAAVRAVLALEGDERAFLAARCRTEAGRFAPAVVAERLLAELRVAAQANVA